MPKGHHNSKRGPPPKSAALRAIDGNAGRRPLSSAVPRGPEQLAFGEFDMTLPLLIEDNPDARAEWNHIAPVLAHARVLTRADRRVVTLYCLASANFDELARRLADMRAQGALAGGLLAVRPSGEVGLSPLFNGFNRAVKTYLQLAAEIGATPAARARVAQVDAPPVANPFARNGPPKTG